VLSGVLEGRKSELLCAVLCMVLCTTGVYNTAQRSSDTHTREQFLHLCIVVSFRFLFVFLYTGRFSLLRVLSFMLCHFYLVLFAFVVLGSVSSVLGQEIGWEERLRNDLFCVEWDVKPSYHIISPNLLWR